MARRGQESIAAVDTSGRGDLSKALQRAGRDLNAETFQAATEQTRDWRDIFGGPPFTITPTDHHASTLSLLSVVRKTRWVSVVSDPLGYV